MIAGDGLSNDERQELRAAIRHPSPTFTLYRNEYLSDSYCYGEPFDDINDPARVVPSKRVVVEHTSRSTGPTSPDDLDDRLLGRTIVDSLLGGPPGVEGPSGLRRSELRRIAFMNNLYAIERRMTK